MIGCARAYSSRNRLAITWVNNYRYPIWTTSNSIDLVSRSHSVWGWNVIKILSFPVHSLSKVTVDRITTQSRQSGRTCAVTARPVFRALLLLRMCFKSKFTRSHYRLAVGDLGPRLKLDTCDWTTTPFACQSRTLKWVVSCCFPAVCTADWTNLWFYTQKKGSQRFPNLDFFIETINW